MSLAPLILKPKQDKRLRQGHIWIYSNEVDTKATPLKGFEAGQQVEVKTSQGKSLGVAHINPNNLICGRLLSRSSKLFGRGNMMKRIESALALREACFTDGPYYRLIYGESDGLPGLVVDRFGDYLVVQISTAGMEKMKSQIQGALTRILDVKGIVWKNDGKMRSLEGLDEYVECADDIPHMLPLMENGTRFEAPVIEGQKTGWFYDHRLNRQRVNQLVKGKRVLDICSYIGGWGVQAAHHGAAEVVCVDASQQALDWVKHNAELNGVAEKVSTIKGDAFKVMEQLQEQQEQFDVVILDPPAFIPKRKDIGPGERAYGKMNQLGMRLLKHEGFLVSASCSMHLDETRLVSLLNQAGRHLDRQVQIIERGSQGPDHPVHPAIPETRYIKSLLCRVSYRS
ncbi:class I SAM-dependent rRNA methyltransferase [Bermanella marisrubri]|uniref:SAM-dependent methyltransferase n=1 Tax=Bermanella marisrubri TaxID=207949 RepID=Q1N4F0_9GAMM|nr:class I SAM-dependent rRNA methyltransferase [Bermanella marisrubri]EAT12915.1 hypothetical protein RED65_14502 [Oceanobacter sp. RED65] [Bermanella marisrubri]QIZ82953.1 class I SAM-dependent rRNA methyltransferase [Bermanella marisrubri]